MKRDRKGRMSRIFDTSKCSAKFRKARIQPNRKRSFNEDRDLGFKWDRDIDARLQGVVFREQFAIGFRNIGISNLDYVMDEKDWPKTEKAKLGDTLAVSRSKGYQKRWGQDRSYQEEWGVPSTWGRRATRLKPQVTRAVVIEEPNVSWEEPKGKPEPGAGQEPSPVDRKRAYAYNEYGLSLMEDGDFSGAVNYFKEAIKLDPIEDVYKINLQRCNEWLDYKKRRRR
ncbi:MAG: tetratricopeptide repeat protein [Thermoplasmatota archaeon]